MFLKVADPVPTGQEGSADYGESDPCPGELIRQAQRELPLGTAAFREIVERHTSLVYRRAARLVGPGPDAEEVTQEVFLRVFRSLQRYRFERPFAHWLLAVTTNSARNFLRGHFREQRKRAEYAAAARQKPVKAEPPDMARRVAVQRALDTLDPTTRLAITLRFLEGESYPSIAAQLGLGESATKMRVRRGLERLRTQLEEVR